MIGAMAFYLVAGVQRPAIIPEPLSLKWADDAFVITAATKIVVNKETAALGAQLQEFLRPATGFALESTTRSSPNAISLKLDAKASTLGDEGYRMTANAKGITISARKPAGLYYGFQTLRQLLPASIWRKGRVEGVKWAVPAVTIEDIPRFSWRGLMLDPCRHFIPKESVLKFIDLLAMHKMNVLHFHLTDDQGWRIEIKKYPKLTEIGSVRKESHVGHYRDQKWDGKPHGGYYTQEDLREIVAYAQARYVNVVPEIEMPGHALAALAAYPELSCTGGPFEVGTKWGVMDDIFCAGNDQVIPFLRDVLDETMEIFPSTFIHIGGDEAPKARWQKCSKCQARIKANGLKDEHELQSWFVKQMDTYLDSKGRHLIGWDEILEGGLAPGAAVMSWRGVKGGIAAAQAGHPVVMSPNSHLYLDYYQTQDNKNEPISIGGFVSLNKVYSYDPVDPSLTPDQAKAVLGTQGNLWSEYIGDPKHLEYMAFPRACALSEVAWSSSKRDFKAFIERLDQHLPRLQSLDVNFRKPKPEDRIAK